VVGEITVGCGRCDGCRIAGRGHCDVRSVLGILGRDGAFAEYLALPSINLHAVPDSLDDLAAVFVEPTAAAYRVAEQVEITDRTRAAVVGARAASDCSSRRCCAAGRRRRGLRAQ
jgi:threonine dehydrogenase-like Zn-dependent dehydrogenase